MCARDGIALVMKIEISGRAGNRIISHSLYVHLLKTKWFKRHITLSSAVKLIRGSMNFEPESGAGHSMPVLPKEHKEFRAFKYQMRKTKKTCNKANNKNIIIIIIIIK